MLLLRAISRLVVALTVALRLTLVVALSGLVDHVIAGAAPLLMTLLLLFARLAVLGRLVGIVEGTSAPGSREEST